MKSPNCGSSITEDWVRHVIEHHEKKTKEDATVSLKSFESDFGKLFNIPFLK